MRYILFFLMFSSGLFAQGIEPNSLQPTPYQGGILKGVTPYVDPFSGDTYYIYQHDTLVLNPDSIYVKTATAPDPDTIYLRDGSGFALIPKGGGGGSGTLKGTGTPTQVAYFAASDSLASDSDMYFDAVNKRLGINENTPTANVHIQGDGNTSATSSLLVEDSGNTTLLRVRNDGQLQVKTTTVNNPAYSFVDAPTTGFYHFGGGTFGVVSNQQYALLVDDRGIYQYTDQDRLNDISYPNLGLRRIGANQRLSVWINGNKDTQLEAWEAGVSYNQDIILNQLGGFVGIRNSNPQRTLHVTGEARITDLVTDTPTRIVGADADGDLGELKVGNGLIISNDSLIVTVSGGGDDWGTQVVESDITLLGDGTAGNVLKVDTSIIATQHDLTTINTDNQNLSHTVSGTDRTINISGGTGTTISVADNDNSSTNELNTSLTVSHIAGNALPRVRITDAGGTLEGLVPFFSTSNVNAGVVPGSNGASNSNFLRADGIWATPVSSGMTNWNLGINNGSYTAVGDGANVSLNAGTNVTLSKSGNTVTINSPSRQTWADFGSNMQAWFSTGAYGSGKDVGIGVSPTADLDVNGTTRLRGPIFNSANSSGTSGQVLTSQGPGTPWTWTTISSTDDQNLSYGTKSGNRIPLDIQDGVGVNIDQGEGVVIDRTSSNVITFHNVTSHFASLYNTGNVLSNAFNTSFNEVPFNSLENNVITGSTAGNSITIATTGKYEISFYGTVNFGQIGDQVNSFDISVYRNSSDIGLRATHRGRNFDISTDNRTPYSRSFVMSLTAGDVLECVYKRVVGAATEINIYNANFTVKRLE